MYHDARPSECQILDICVRTHARTHASTRTRTSCAFANECYIWQQDTHDHRIHYGLCCLSSRHEDEWGSGIMVLLILNLGNGSGEWSASFLGRFTPEERGHANHSVEGSLSLRDGLDTS